MTPTMILRTLFNKLDGLNNDRSIYRNPREIQVHLGATASLALLLADRLEAEVSAAVPNLPRIRRTVGGGFVLTE